MRIINFGSLNRDLVYRVPHAVRPGETIASTEMEVFCGGKGLNSSLAMARAGAEVCHAGCIGADGTALKNMLTESGVDTTHLRVLDGESGHAVIQLDENGQNSILLFGGANQRITEQMIDEVLGAFAPGDMLVLQNEINNLPYLFEKAQKCGSKIWFNPSPFTDALLHLPLSSVDCLAVNEIEAAQFSGENEPMRALSVLRERYPNTKLLLTLGADGALYDDCNTQYRVGTYDVPVVDTTGAGDTFFGYFAAMLAQVGAQTALTLAAGAASLAVSKKGAAASIPTVDEVRAFCDAHTLVN